MLEQASQYTYRQNGAVRQNNHPILVIFMWRVRGVGGGVGIKAIAPSKFQRNILCFPNPYGHNTANIFYVKEYLWQ